MDNSTQNNLLQTALTASENAYAPYSNFYVGCALIGIDNNIYTGCNVENASYSLTMCAERNAIFSMVAKGCSKFKAIAIASKNNTETYPCGACRQVMLEFCENENTPVLVYSKENTPSKTTVSELLPHSFTKESMI